MSTAQPSYLIVGAGVFGASTALHLSRQQPSASIVLIDRTPFPCPIAASHDINKVVRADYEDIFYCDLALKALDRWRNEPIFKQWYHQAGMVTIENGEVSLGKQIIDNFKKLGVHYEAEIFRPEEMKTRFGGLFSDADYEEVDEIFWNPLSGWAEATRALTSAIEAAVENGVQYVAASVARLLLEDGRCTGVKTEDGRIFPAANIILCTGAGTAKLLADSAPDQPELQVGNRITAAAVCTAAVSLNPEQVQRFKDVPVFVLDAGKTQGQTMPPTPDGQLKFIRDVTFKNTVEHAASGQMISVPVISTERSQWTSPQTIPAGLREELAIVMKGIYGNQAQDLKPDTFRICWDGFTMDSNWFICPHPRCHSLYVATGGTFHGWKFLPIVGEYVIKMLEGELSEEMIRRWSWDRSFEGFPKDDKVPERELRDIKTSLKRLSSVL